jgi:hypothetical protein
MANPTPAICSHEKLWAARKASIARIQPSITPPRPAADSVGRCNTSCATGSPSLRTAAIFVVVAPLSVPM